MTNLKELQIKLQKNKWWILFILSLVLLIFGLTISIVFYCVLRDSNYTLADSTHKVSISETGNIGDFVGGVVGTVLSFASVILLILTLTVQRDQNKLDRFGQTFYEMLHIHNDNVTSMKLKDVDNTTGRDVFSKLVTDYEHIYDIVHGCFENIRSLVPLSGKDREEKKAVLESMQEYLKDRQKTIRLNMRIAYGFFFYGSEKFLLKSEMPAEKEILEHVKHLLVLGNNMVCSHNVLLGHYYRHMFQMLKLVENTSFLDEKEKYGYAKQLRAQLNDDEQVLLYYNSLSDIGKDWIVELGQKDRKKMCLIARFRMIKNIPYYKEIKGIQPQELFKTEMTSYKENHENFFEVERS